jgi:hypothetical protein
MNAESLTKILHRRAEVKLLKEITASLPRIQDVSSRVNLTDETKRKLSRMDGDGGFWVPTLIEAAIEAVYALRVDAARSAEVKEFLAKVEKTAEDLNEIMEGME